MNKQLKIFLERVIEVGELVDSEDADINAQLTRIITLGTEAKVILRNLLERQEQLRKDIKDCKDDISLPERCACGSRIYYLNNSIAECNEC